MAYIVLTAALACRSGEVRRQDQPLGLERGLTGCKIYSGYAPDKFDEAKRSNFASLGTKFEKANC